MNSMEIDYDERPIMPFSPSPVERVKSLNTRQAKSRRESCPASLQKKAREEIHFRKRFGLTDGMEQSLNDLQLGFETRSPSPRRHSSNTPNPEAFVTPRFPMYNQQGDSPMEIDSPENNNSPLKWFDQVGTLLPKEDVSSDKYKFQTKVISLELSDQEDSEYHESKEEGHKFSMLKQRPSSPKNKIQPVPYMHEGRPKRPFLKTLCYCNIALVALCVMGIFLFAVATRVRQITCAESQVMNTTSLNLALKRFIHGQHIALDIITEAIDTLMKDESKRYLVMSFHGWTGIGKTYISNILAAHVKKHFAHRLVIPLHFPHLQHDAIYEQQIRDSLIMNISRCAVNLFLIDEMDKATPGIIQGLESAIQEIKQMPLNDSRVIIVLVSNTGGATINRHVLKHLDSGYKREQLTDSNLVSGILSAEDADWLRHINDGGYVDRIVPFLPLEKQHVRMCIEFFLEMSSYIKEQAIRVDVEKVLNEITFLPKENPMFSKSGCREVHSKVDLMSELDLSDFNLDMRDEL